MSITERAATPGRRESGDSQSGSETPRLILLNPGPVCLSERVREALRGPDLCHREPEFAALQASIREALLEVYALPADDWAAILLTGSGTAAVEAMIASLVPEGGRLLVVENGVYGERMTAIAHAHGIACRALHHPWGAAIDEQALANALESEPDVTNVAVVHHETTTGRLNDLRAIGALCDRRGVGLLVDAVSSFGAEALEFESGAMTACAATANKCLHGVPGTSFVVTRRSALPSSTAPRRSLYLDLGVYCREQDRGATPFTQSVQCFYALAEALREHRETGGWRARRAYYRDLASLVRTGLTSLGVRPLLAAEETSAVLAAYHLPEGIDYDTLHDGLKAAGFVIYAGQGGLAQRIFRVSTMGEITRKEMQRFVDAVGSLVSA